MSQATKNRDVTVSNTVTYGIVWALVTIGGKFFTDVFIGWPINRRLLMTDPRNTATQSDDFPIAPPFTSPSAGSSKGVEKLRKAIRSNSPNLRPGDQLGDYQLLEMLGAGAMGTVFKARHAKREKSVALKILDANFVRQKDALRRFQKEASLLAQADSPHITQLLDVCEIDDRHIIVMELVEGTTAAALLKDRRQLNEVTAIDIVSEVAEALIDISSLHILHRDIKPENILLSTNGNDAKSEFFVKLTDFGLARHTDQSRSMAMTRENSVLGTPLYMSPEQFADASNLDVRSDLYSLGATLFHLLTGQPPFAANDVLRLAELHRHTPAPDLRSINSNLSDAVSEVVRKCLQKRPDLRYATATELLSDLRRVRRGEAISISIHPLIPKCDTQKLQAFRFEWDLVSTPGQLWPYVSNTERVNRAIGLPAVHYTTSAGHDDQVKTYANVRIAGIAMRWQEHVFEWIEERRMGVLREFETGPLKWFTSVVEFIPAVDGGTRLVHTFKVEGRGWLGRKFAKFKLGREARRSLSKVYARIDGVLAETRGADALVDAFERNTQLSHSQQARFDRLIQNIQQHKVNREALLQLTEFVRTAPAQAVGRIRPLAIAQQLNLPFDQVVEVLLRGAKIGMFELVWEVICPSCRIATQTYDLMKMISDHEHCDACNLHFDVDLTNQVEAVFRVHSQIRKVDTGKYCIGGPAHSPHVVAQTRLTPGETVNLGLSLTGGTYCIRGPQLANSLSFSVRSETIIDGQSASHALSLNLARDSDWKQQNIYLASGMQLVTIHNDFDREIILRVERATQRSDALTAAKIIGIPLFRELFPAQTFAKSQLAALTNITLLQTALSLSNAEGGRLSEVIARPLLQIHLQELSSHCTLHGGNWVKIVDAGALMAFCNSNDALRCARAIGKTLPPSTATTAATVKCAVASGDVTVSMICGQLDYLGSPVEQLRQLLDGAAPSAVAVGFNELDSGGEMRAAISSVFRDYNSSHL